MEASIIDTTVVDLSRLQFALTALYHFLFVPLTLGLSIIIAIMESVYVMTGRDIWRQMTKFWGVLFGINFALGVSTGITMEFQFGMNWSYYSHYVGDIFGAPLAIEGLMAFFLEATFVGLFFFGWNKISKVQHLTVTWLMALGTNFSALWILIANGWMQFPAGAAFNPETMRMEVIDFGAVLFNPIAQAKFVHTVSAGYVTGAAFVLAVSAYYLLQKQHREFALRSMTVAASFGLASALSVVVLGDESGYVTTEHQEMKLAAMEAEWHTEDAPAGFNIIAFPNMEERENHFAVKVPWVLGLIATRSIDTPVRGINELVEVAEGRIRQGMEAYGAVQAIRADKTDEAAWAIFRENEDFIGYGLLLKKYIEDPTQANDAMIAQAAWDTVPNVPWLFWTFRFMVMVGILMIALFATAFYFSAKRKLDQHKWFLRIALFAMPLPWIAVELGWFVAEFGRQPWVVEGVLPTFIAASSLTLGQILITMTGFVVMYSTLAYIMVMLMLKTIRIGPTRDITIDDLTPEAMKSQDIATSTRFGDAE